MKKRALCIILAALTAFSVLTGCGSGNNQQTTSTPAEPSAPTAPTQEAAPSAPAASSGLTEKIELSFAHSQQPDASPVGQAAQDFAKKVYEDSNGMIEIKVFPASQLGGERDELEGLSMGTIDMAYISAGVTENYAPTAGIYNLPFIFDDYDHALAVVSNEEINGYIDAELRNSNVMLLTPLLQGNRYTYTTKPVDFGKLDSLKGLKIRVPEAPMATGIWKSLSCNPTAIAWNELYTAMSTKIVEGFEVHVHAVLMEKLEETFSHCYLTNHQTSVSCVMFSIPVWNSLPAEAQKIISDNIGYLIEKNNGYLIPVEEEQIQYLRDYGITVTEVTPEQKEAIKTLCADLQNGWLQKTSNAQKMYDIVQSLRK